MVISGTAAASGRTSEPLLPTPCKCKYDINTYGCIANICDLREWMEHGRTPARPKESVEHQTRSEQLWRRCKELLDRVTDLLRYQTTVEHHQEPCHTSDQDLCSSITVHAPLLRASTPHIAHYFGHPAGMLLEIQSSVFILEESIERSSVSLKKGRSICEMTTLYSILARVC